MGFKVLLTDARHESYDIERSLLEQAGAELITGNFDNKADLLAAVKDADGLLVDMAKCDAEVIAAAEKCKVISRYGVGYDNVDIRAAGARGILVTNVPDYCPYDVSDHALALLMACMRGIATRDRKIREGKWNIVLPHSHRFKGRTLAIIGFGRIGSSLAKKVSGFELGRIVAVDPVVDAETMAAYGVEKVDFETALKEADLISVHAPCDETSKDLFDSHAFSLMKPNAILVNTARGPIINADALYEALSTNKIFCAGIDTHCCEPLGEDSPFKTLDNIILTDHNAYNTIEAVADLKTKAAQNVITVLQGNMPTFVVNRKELA